VRKLVVDGEHFEVSERAGEPGVHDLRWATGPNEGYGFASAKYGGGGQTDAELEDAIRDVLSQVDPTTGYIG
jgi:hypothetical protein